MAGVECLVRIKLLKRNVSVSQLWGTIVVVAGVAKYNSHTCWSEFKHMLAAH